MTLSEIKALDKEFLTPAEIAPILGCDAQDIRVTARQRPDLIGFNFTFVGTRMKIPRRAFIKWVEGGEG